MPSSNSFTKKAFLLGLFSYLVLFVLAVVFYKERTIFIDVAFRFFAMIKAGDYVIQVYRFGSYFTQSFLYLSYVIGLPLKYIMINYSVGFIIYKALIFLLCFKFLKCPKLAITLLLTDVLIVSETFYWIQSELVESISFLILYFAVLQNFASKKLHILRLVLLLGMLITVIFFHPLSFILFTFVSLFCFLSSSDKTERVYLLGGFPFMLGLVVIKSLYFTSIYDNTGISALNNFVTFFPDYLSLPSNSRFLRYLIQDYYFLPILFFGVLGYYVTQRIWSKFWLLLSFFLGYLLLVNVSLTYNDKQFHMESFYMPLSLFLSLAFAVDILPILKKQQALIVLGFIIGCRLLHIGFQHQKFTNALNWKRDLIKKTAHLEHNKLAISDQHVPMDTLMLSWGSSYEFWLLSTLEFNETRSIIIYHDKKNTIGWGKMKAKDAIITQWSVTAYKDLPKQYFIFKDSTSEYVHYNPQEH